MASDTDDPSRVAVMTRSQTPGKIPQGNEVETQNQFQSLQSDEEIFDSVPIPSLSSDTIIG